MPRWRSTNLPSVGASLSMKKRLMAAKERKTASEASLSTPPSRPSVRALKPALIEALACWLASAAVEEATPRPWSQDSISSAPEWSLWLRLSAWLAMPLMTMTPTPIPIRTIPRKTSTAPAPLGSPCRFSQSTRGTVTEATIAAVTTGITIVCVCASRKIAPTSAAATPTSNQALKPRSRSQAGAENIPLSSAGSISMTSSSAGALARAGRHSRPRIGRLGVIGSPHDTRRPRHGPGVSAMTAAARVTYVGHATVLVEIDGVRLLTDPVLRRRVGPLRRHGAAARPAADGGRRRGADLPPPPRPCRRALAAAAEQDGAGARRARGRGLPRAPRLLRRPRAGPRRFRRHRRRPRHRHRGRPPTQRAALRAGLAGGRLRARRTAAHLLRRRHRPLRRHGGDRRRRARPRPAADLGLGHEHRRRAPRPRAGGAGGGAALAEAGGPDPLGHALPARPARGCAPSRCARPPREFATWMRELAPQSELRVLAPGEATSLA